MPNKLRDGRKLVEVASNDFGLTVSDLVCDGDAQLTQLDPAEG